MEVPTYYIKDNTFFCDSQSCSLIFLGGQEIVFQAGPENPWLIKTYAEVAPYPSAQALGQELFQSGIIPSDTDFRIYRDYGGIPGVISIYIAILLLIYKSIPRVD